MKFEKFEQPFIADKNNRKETQPQEEEKIKPEQAAAERIKSAEQKVAELSKDGQKRVDAVEKGLDLPAEDIIIIRNEVGLFSRFKKNTEKANSLLAILKEKFSNFLAGEKTPDIAGEKLEGAKGPEYQDFRDYLKYEQRELSRPIIEEAKKKRNELLEARGILLMSKEDFSRYFSSKDFEICANLKQQNIGDCYAVAAIHAMSRSPHFEIICRSSMKRLPDGSWQVKVPLMSESGQMVAIAPEEISPQWNKQFLRRNKYDKLSIDLRPRLKIVKGKEGLQVLEAAFIKAKFGTVDRLAAEGGWGDEVLLQLGGENFQRYRLNSAVYNSEKKKWEYPGLISLNGKQQAYLDHYLENFDPEIHIATVSTKHEKGGTFGFYKVKGTSKFLIPRHSYSVSNVDREKKIISLANPWDTSKLINLTFNQFKENFSGFEAIKINSARLLQNMKKIEREIA